MFKKIGLELLTIFLICCALLLLKTTSAQPAAKEPVYQQTSQVVEKVVSTSESSGLIDINLATAEELDAIPGVGPVIAERIVHDRAENGYYSNLSEIVRIKGIGTKKYQNMIDFITLDQRDLIIYLGY